MCLGPEIALAASIIGGASAIGGTALSIQQGQQAAAASRRAERLRKQQMNLEFLQKQREAIRAFQLNRATSVSNIVGGTGSVLGGGSAVGALGGLTSTLSTNLGELGQAQSIGAGIFDANADYATASANAQAGSALAGFGKDLFSSSQEIGRIGATAFGSKY